MSVVSLLGVKVLNNPAKFTDTYHFEITFECLEQLQRGIYFERDRNLPSILADACQTLNGSLHTWALLLRMLCQFQIYQTLPLAISRI